MERSCLDCGGLVRGRSDKKFCDDACRNNYNNRLHAEHDLMVKRINQILRRNRAILISMVPNGKSKIAKSKLMKAGFDFDYHTHYLHTQNGKTYFFCYEFGYLDLANDELLLIKREEYKWKQDK
ncbi:hypothetical protein [Pedobacter frigidisoli]|uniref:hypothetical protein n=1 Tax=Pedobacter frigidisoli TaxID=2530455 RepID=UPI00292FAEE0|nr:hypothetical protein [Pedobacter frigidisoli]